MRYRTGFLWGRLNMEPGVLLQDPEGHWPSLSSLQNSHHVSLSWFLPLQYFITSQWFTSCCVILSPECLVINLNILLFGSRYFTLKASFVSLQMFTCLHVGKWVKSDSSCCCTCSGFTSPDVVLLVDWPWIEIDHKCSAAINISFVMITVVIKTLAVVLQPCSHSWDIWWCFLPVKVTSTVCCCKIASWHLTFWHFFCSSFCNFCMSDSPAARGRSYPWPHWGHVLRNISGKLTDLMTRRRVYIPQLGN